MALDVIIKNPMMHVNIACCPTSIITLRSDGTLWALGTNKNGEFGVPPAEVASSSTWMQLELDNVERLFNVFSGVYAVRKDGSLWYTGYAKSSYYTPEKLSVAADTWTEYELKGVIKAFKPRSMINTVAFCTSSGQLFTKIPTSNIPILANGTLHDIIDIGYWGYFSGSYEIDRQWYLSKTGILYFVDTEKGNLRGSPGPFNPSGQLVGSNVCISASKPIKELWVDNSRYDSSSTDNHSNHFYGGYRALYFDGTVGVRCVKYNTDYNANGNYAFGSTSNATMSHTVLSVTDVKQTYSSNNNIKQNMYLLKTDGTVWVCGSNTKGCLGINSTTTQIGLVQSQIDKVEYISGPDSDKVSGYKRYTVFVKKDGGLFIL